MANLSQPATLGNLKQTVENMKVYIDSDKTVSIKGYLKENNTHKFYNTSTPTADTAPIFSFDVASEYFLDQTKTTFVQEFAWSDATYTGSTNPNLDGKPVFVLAVKGEDSVSYSFVNLETLIDTYKTKDSATLSLDITDNEISGNVNISAEEGNAVVQKNDGLYVATTAETKVSQTENNIIETKEDGIYVAPTDVSNLVEKVDGKTLSTNDLTNEMVEKIENTYTKDETYSRAEVDEAIANAQIGGEDVDLSSYATKEYVDNAVNGVDVDLTGYATETFVTDKIAEIEIPSLDGYAKTDDIPTVTNDLTNELKEKYDKAEENVQSDWDETDETSDAFIKNKPTIPSTDRFVTEEGLSNTLSAYAKSEDIPDTSNYVEKEEGKGLFSGNYNDLTDTPAIPSVDGLVSEDTLSETLKNYAKTDDLPEEYDDTALANRVTANEEAIATLNGYGEGSVAKAVDDALNEFATNISNDGVVNTYKELVDYAAEHSSDIAEIVADIETNTTAIEGLDGRIDTLETNLGNHTIKADVPADAKFTDTTNFLPLDGGSMSKNANVTIPSANLVASISLSDDSGYTTTLSPDCLHVQDDEGNTTVVGGSSVHSDEFVGDLTGKVNGYTVNADVPSNAVFTDTVYTHPTYTARTGKPTTNQTPAFGGTATVSQITSDATGHITGITDRTIKIPSTLSNGTGTAGLIKTSSNVTSNSGYTACPVINGVPYYKPSTATTTDGANPDVYQDKKIVYGTSSVDIEGGVAWGNNITVDGGEFGAFGFGESVTSTGSTSFAIGWNTEVASACALAIGSYNDDTSTGTNIYFYSWIQNDQSTKNAFMIGRGSAGSGRANAFRVTYAGATYALSAFNSSGADYAEFISEWADGNPNNEDRVGYFVTLKDDKLYKANDGDYILGITSGNPSVVGNGDETYFWKYERDEFNRFIYVDTPLLDENGEEYIDENGNVVTGKTMKLSESYDPTQTYIARKDRPEWDYVGMTGVIPVRDDGTCVVNGYCKCGKDGIATLATEKGDFTYFVKERISDNVISVIIR